MHLTGNFDSLDELGDNDFVNDYDDEFDDYDALRPKNVTLLHP